MHKAAMAFLAFVVLLIVVWPAAVVTMLACLGAAVIRRANTR